MLTEISYVQISSYRTKVMKSLDDGEVLIPTQIARNSDIRPNHISKVLSKLKHMNQLNVLIQKSEKVDDIYALIKEINQLKI